MITKDDVLAALWRGTVVSDAALATCIRDLRRVLSDTSEAPRSIETARSALHRNPDGNPLFLLNTAEYVMVRGHPRLGQPARSALPSRRAPVAAGQGTAPRRAGRAARAAAPLVTRSGLR